MGIKLSAKSLAALKGVHPDLAKFVMRAAAMSDIPFEVTEGLRSVAQQKENIKNGVSWTMNSRHLTGHAVDIRPMEDVNKDGKITVAEMYSWPVYYKLAPVLKAAAKAVNVPIVWGGDWKKSKDGPHWELDRRRYPAPQSFLGLHNTEDIADYRQALDTPYPDPETDTGAAVKAASYGATGAAMGGGMAADPLMAVADGLSTQQYEITSGDIVRIVLGVVIIAIGVWAAYKTAKG